MPSLSVVVVVLHFAGALSFQCAILPSKSPVARCALPEANLNNGGADFKMGSAAERAATRAAKAQHIEPRAVQQQQQQHQWQQQQYEQQQQQQQS